MLHRFFKIVTKPLQTVKIFEIQEIRAAGRGRKKTKRLARHFLVNPFAKLQSRAQLALFILLRRIGRPETKTMPKTMAKVTESAVTPLQKAEWNWLEHRK